MTAIHDCVAAFNRQRPFVDVRLSDIAESGEALDLDDLVREERSGGFETGRLRPWR